VSFTRGQWQSFGLPNTDWETSDEYLIITTPDFYQPYTSITPIIAGDLQWIDFNTIPIPSGSIINTVTVCYQLFNTSSYISQVRLTSQSVTDYTLVVFDDPTDLLSTSPACYTTTANVVVNGSMALSLRLDFGEDLSNILIGGAWLDFTLPDLAVTSFNFSVSGPSVDQVFGATVSTTIINEGGSPAIAPFTVALYTSDTATIDPSTSRLISGSSTLIQTDLQPGESIILTFSANSTISSTWPDSNYPCGNVYVGIYADTDDNIDESSKANNYESQEVTITCPQQTTGSISGSGSASTTGQASGSGSVSTTAESGATGSASGGVTGNGVSTSASGGSGNSNINNSFKYLPNMMFVVAMLVLFASF